MKVPHRDRPTAAVGGEVRSVYCALRSLCHPSSPKNTASSLQPISRIPGQTLQRIDRPAAIFGAPHPHLAVFHAPAHPGTLAVQELLGGRSKTIFDTLGNLGDFIGGLAVIVTLAYLAVQVRQNSQQLRENAAATRAATYQAAMNVVTTLQMETAKHAHIARFIVLTPEERDRLTPIERVQWEGTIVAILRATQHIYMQHLAGLVDEHSWLSHAGAIRRVLANPVTQELWKRRRDEFAPDFAQRLDVLMERSSPNVPAA